MASPSASTSPMQDNADYILAVEQLAQGAFAERWAAADTLGGLAGGWRSSTANKRLRWLLTHYARIFAPH